MRDIYFAGGCFWGVEKFLALLEGVAATEVGYANGGADTTSYEAVCSGAGHAEAVKVTYDETAAPLGWLLEQFFSIIDPTTLYRQGPDVGVQYRTGVYYTDEADREVILRALERLGTKYEAEIVVECEPLRNYCTAELYHQKYLERRPNGYCHIGRDAFARARAAKPPRDEV